MAAMRILAAQRIAIMGICNKLAGMLAPLAIGALVMHGMGDLSAQVASADAATKAQLLDAFAARIHGPYMIMACLLALLAVGIGKKAAIERLVGKHDGAFGVAVVQPGNAGLLTAKRRKFSRILAVLTVLTSCGWPRWWAFTMM